MSFSFGNGEWKIMGMRSKGRCVISDNNSTPLKMMIDHAAIKIVQY